MDSHRDRPVRQWKLIGQWCIFGILVIAASYASYIVSLRTGTHDLQEEAKDDLAVISRAVLAPAQKFSYLPDIVSSHPAVIDFFKSGTHTAKAATLNRFLEDINSAAKSETIFVITTSGLTVASSNWATPQSFVGKNFSYRPYFLDAIQHARGRYYAVGAVSGVPGYYLSRSIEHQGNIIGVVVVKIRLSYLETDWMTHRSNHNQKRKITVSDQNGIVFLTSELDWKYRSFTNLDAKTLRVLSHTRQFEGVLGSPLPLIVERRLSPNDYLASVVERQPGKRTARAEQYLVRAESRDDEGWNVTIFLSTEKKQRAALHIAALTGGGVALMMLTFMYIQQSRRRLVERDRQHRALQSLNEKLHILATTDPLTGLHNRRFFFETAAKMLSSAKRHSNALSIILIDIDHFKKINDQYGHGGGDKALQEMARICRSTLRQEDCLARIGGEEFIIALPLIDQKGASEVANRLRKMVGSTVMEESGHCFLMTLSCGVSELTEHDQEISTIINRADNALYAAKEAGRNQTVIR